MSENHEEFNTSAPRRRRAERRKEASLTIPEMAEEEYAAQRRAFHEQPTEPDQKKEAETEKETVVPGGRAARNRRQNRENVTDPSSSAESRSKSDSSKEAEGPIEVFGTRGYQPEKSNAGKQADRKEIKDSADAPKQPKGNKPAANAHADLPSAGKKESKSSSVTSALPPQNVRTTGPVPQQNANTTGPVPQQNARTTGPIPQQNVRTTGPVPQQNVRTTGPIPQQNVRTTGPIPQQNVRTTGPVPQQNVRTTGPIPQQNARTTGPIPQQNVRTTGPIPQQNVRMTGPIPQQNVRTTGPINAQNQSIRNTGEVPGWGNSGPIPEQRVWASNNRGMNGYTNGYIPNQKMPSGQEGGWKGAQQQQERQNIVFAASQNPSIQHSLNQNFGRDPKASQGNQENPRYPTEVPASSSSGKNHQDGNRKAPFPVKKILLGLCALIILVVGGIFLTKTLKERAAYQAMKEYVESYNDLFVPGVYVDGISLTGMNMTQAQAMVESNARQRSNEWSVNLTYNGMLVRTITGSELSMNVDVQETLTEAWQKGHTGTIEERNNQIIELQTNPYYGQTANPSGDTGTIDAILQEINNQVYRAPQDASIASFDPNRTYPFTFNDEVVGRSLNIAAAKEAVYQSLSSMSTANVELQLETQMPNVTVESIKTSLLELRGSATTPISSSSAEERNANIRTAFSKISGTIIQPGGQFSFNSIVGPRTEKNGFLPAIEYAYGELSDGIGGGVCQASTTVYLAAVRAGMEILKREPHSDAVSYIEYGKDATVYWYSNHKIDMVFRNTTDSPIYITAAVQSSPTRRTNLVCLVNIYGATLNGISYDIATQETVIDPPLEPEYVKDKNADYVTYTDQEKIVRKASPGCSCDSWRVTYQNGKEVDRTFMYTDIYKPKAERIYVGVTQRPSK